MKDFAFSLSNKLMGQVNVVRVGVNYINNEGSEGFARAALLDVRVNVASPPWVSGTLAAMGRDGSAGIPAAQVAAAYAESVESRRNGEVLDARSFRA